MYLFLLHSAFIINFSVIFIQVLILFSVKGEYIGNKLTNKTVKIERLLKRESHILEIEMSLDEKYDAALDLLRRLDPTKVKTNLTNLINLEPDLAEDLLSSVDSQLIVSKDPENSNKEYLCCDYNRDIDSYRSPWSNKYFPQLSEEDLQESPFPNDQLRQLEIMCNDSFDVYRDLYYEGGISSVYLWNMEDETTDSGDSETDFAGVILFKKANIGDWDSIHVFEVTRSAANEYNYKVTTTIILHLENQAEIKTLLAGNLTRQTERNIAVQDETDNLDTIQVAHITNLGTMIEDIESQMRNSLETVYFEKTRDIFQQTRNPSLTAMEQNKEQHEQVIKGLQKL